MMDAVEATVRWGERTHPVRLERKLSGWHVGTLGKNVMIERDARERYRATVTALLGLHVERDAAGTLEGIVPGSGFPISVQSEWRPTMAEAVQMLYDRLLALDTWCESQRASP
jgi:hypothetical protein